jgi:hypothetical protein
MKVVLAKTSDAISVDPANFIGLSFIDNKGHRFHYRLKYLANLAKIFDKNLGGTQVEIAVFKSNSRETEAKIFDKEASQQPEQVVENILNRAKNEQAIINKKENDLILRKNSDITKKISNEAASTLARQSGFNSSVASLAGTNTTITVKAVPINEIDGVASVFEINNNKIQENEVSSDDKDLQKAALDLLFLEGIDPGEFVGSLSNTIVPAKKQFAGVISGAPTPDREDKYSVVLRKSLLTGKAPTSQQDLNESIHYINAPVKEQTLFIEISEDLLIPVDTLRGQTVFDIELRLKNLQGLTVQILKLLVNHAEISSAFKIPNRPPRISGASFAEFGKNIIKLKQEDLNAHKLDLYRKKIKSGVFSLDTPYEFVASLNASAGDPETRYEDFGSSAISTLYRVIPVGTDGELGGCFSGTVISGGNNKKLALGGNYLKRQSYLTLSYEIRENGVVLFVDNLPNGPIGLDILKRDLTIGQSSFDLIGGKTILLKSATERPLEVVDTLVKPRRIYEYRCELLYADGSKSSAGNVLHVEYTPIIKNVVSIEIKNLIINENGSENPDVTFDIVKNVALGDLDIVKSVLASQGITEYDDDIKDNKELLQSLFFIRVLRFNLLSGDIEDFGVIDGTSFSDKTLGAVKNVLSLRSGSSYKYAITAYARTAESMISTVTREVQAGLNQTYTLKPSKFLHPITLSEGNIVSDESLLRNHANSIFTMGAVSDIKYLDVKFNKSIPVLGEVRARSLNEKSILIKWKVIGNSTKIDHFLILLEINGMRTIVGKTHAIGETNEFKFIDTLDNGEHGQLKYVVIPVFYDFNRGPEEAAAPIVI